MSSSELGVQWWEGRPEDKAMVCLSIAPAVYSAVANAFTAWITRMGQPIVKHRERLLDVFIKEEDILACYTQTDVDLTGEDLEALAPNPPASLLVLPLAEATVWLGGLMYDISLRGRFSWTEATHLAVAMAWIMTFLSEVTCRSRLPPWNSLVVFIALFTRASIVTIVAFHDFARLSSRTVYPLIASLPDLLVCTALIITIIDMPLRPRLTSVLRSSDSLNESQPPSPEDTNSLLGALSYSWMGPIMTLARKRPLKPSDVWSLSLNNQAAVLSRKFKLIRAKSLFGRIFRASARDVFIDTCLKWVAVSLNYLRPYWIQRLLEALATDTSASNWTPRDQAYVYATFAFLSLAGASLAQLQHFHHARRVGMRLRSELTVAVYEKSLMKKTSTGAQSKDDNASIGKIVSLISDDTNKVLRWGCDWHVLAGAPLELILALGFLWNLMGWSGLAGIAILAIASPINYRLGRRAVAISRERNAARDARQTSLQEMITSIRTIRFFGWTQSWLGKVHDKRNSELALLLREWRNQFYVTLLWFLVSVAVPVVSFACYTKIQRKPMTVPVAFTALNYFGMARGPLNQIPDFGIKILQCLVSISRIEAYLHEEEIEEFARPENRSTADSIVSFSNATFCYPGTTEGSAALQDIDVAFPEARLSLISGETGSGKSSMLLALLGELRLVKGSVRLPKAVSYAAQHPWLESATIRDSILFGSLFDSSRYAAVLEACALLPDLDILPSRDWTLVGERGVSLSGGQKARVALARAIYAYSEVVLLDDVLSAVDSRTGRHLYEKALRGPLLRGRTVLLCTHHTDLVLPGVSYHVKLHNGLIIEQGLVEQDSHPSEHEGDVELACDDALSTSSGSDEVEKELEKPVIGEETWLTGAVKGSIFKAYLSASSYLLWVALLTLILIRPALSYVEAFWLRKWGESSDEEDYWLLGFGLIGLSYVVVLVMYTVVFYSASLRASKHIFKQLLDRIMHAPSRWFDTTPMGRIINRCTSDISILDDSLAQNFSGVATNVFSMAASLTVTAAVLPSAILPTALFAGIYCVIFIRFLRVSRDLNRIASTTASPLFSGFQQVLVGITTVRAFAQEEAHRQRVMRVLDETLSLWYASCTLDVWLAVRTQLLSGVVLLTTSFFAIHAEISPGLAGIVISSSLYILQYLDSLCNSYGKLVTSLNSLERITEYLELPQEPTGGAMPPAHWPSASPGSAMITVEDLEMRYAPELDLSLRGVTFSVNAGERVAVVGRTGSGKSTLAMSLLRVVDPVGGRIVIDGIDITKVRVDELRSRITLLPQDALLFAGTVRHNIDPFDEYSDEACLHALRRTHLLAADPSEPGTSTPGSTGSLSFGLHTEIAAGGVSLSAGQQQLVSLARALLRDSRILILDESTAALDHALDARIQQTIREEFTDCCLLTIAHRLRTIMDYSRVLVLDAGRVVEYDTPQQLLSQRGLFWELCRQSGDFDELVKAAGMAR